MNINLAKQIIITLLSVSFLLACAGNQVHPNYDQDINFSSFSKYKWKSEKRNEKIHARNPFTHTAIISDIDNYLATKNYKKATNATGDVDFVIDYQVSIETRTKSSNSSISFGTGSHGSHSSVGVGIAMPLGRSRTEKEVTLIISLMDGKQEKIIWRAVHVDTVSGNTSGNRLKKIMQQYANKIISHFPPKREK